MTIRNLARSAALLCVWWATNVFAQPGLPQSGGDDWQFRFVPYVWLPAVDGQFGIGNQALGTDTLASAVSAADIDASINEMNNGLVSDVLWLRSQAQPEFNFQYNRALEAIERMRQALKLPIFKTDVEV